MPLSTFLDDVAASYLTPYFFYDRLPLHDSQVASMGTYLKKNEQMFVSYHPHTPVWNVCFEDEKMWDRLGMRCLSGSRESGALLRPGDDERGHVDKQTAFDDAGNLA